MHFVFKHFFYYILLKKASTSEYKRFFFALIIHEQGWHQFFNAPILRIKIIVSSQLNAKYFCENSLHERNTHFSFK